MPAFYKRLTRKRRRQLRHVSITVGVGVAFALVFTFVQPFASIQWRLSDMLFVPYEPSSNIVIAAIDDASLEEYGKWSDWPRSLHAQAIENLDDAKARVIGFDVLFSDESPDDAEFAQAIADAGNVVLAVTGSQQVSSPNQELTYSEVLHPEASLENASVATGHTHIFIGGGGVVREMPMEVKDIEGDSYPALTLSVLYTHFGLEPPSDFDVENGAIFVLDDRYIPVDDAKSMRINYAGPPGTYTQISYADIIDGSFDPELVKLKIVLVGMTATGEPDAWVTPISPTKMYGVEIHANALDTILNQRFITEAGAGMTFLLMLAITLILGIALPFLNLRWGSLLSVAVFAAYFAAIIFSMESGYILNILYPLLLVPIIYITAVLCSVTSAQTDRRVIRDLFGRYVSPQVVKEIIRMTNTDQLKLGGARREVTVLFADIRGFTAMSERMDPDSIVETLNRYLAVIIERILANDGMINKFVGDNVMAVWNAPQDQPGHALLAVKTALESQHAVSELAGDSSETLQFGIGVNTGSVVAGNVGAEGRTEYTIIGDAVNLAARLSSAPGGEVWIGAETYNQVKDTVDVEELEPQQFKGKAEAVRVYRVLGLRSQGGNVE